MLYSVSQKIPWSFLAFSPKGWEFFAQILYACYTFLSTLDYKFSFNYIQLWRNYATTQRAFRPMVDIWSIWWWSGLIWHNFVKGADNWIKMTCSPAEIGTYNWHVKFGLKILNRLGGNVRKSHAGDFFWLTLYTVRMHLFRNLTTFGNTEWKPLAIQLVKWAFSLPIN